MNYKILEKFKLTEDEKKFLNDSKNPETSTMNYSRVISNIYLAKTIEHSTDKTIESNKKLADSNNAYTKGMLWLTGGLIFVGLVDVGIQILLKFCE